MSQPGEPSPALAHPISGRGMAGGRLKPSDQDEIDQSEESGANGYGDQRIVGSDV